ncbi:hypothetical protein ABDD95_16720 [Mucilaginibacter sp. PAMB04274]|uniref:hypothetical protein n=1 Tax=Mucilaginibacter sp. PAMB04274 TaxID=3138568 RepID=UPI0031F6DCB5
MPKFSLLLCVALCLAAFLSYGQQAVKGRVLEDKTRVGLAGIHVQNLNTKQSAVSDNKGKFIIKASLNDLLLFKGFAYQNDTLLITKLNDFEVFLLPQQHMLNGVEVKTMEGPSLIFLDPYFHGQTTAYQTDRAGNFKGGVAFRLWYWKKDERRKQRQEQMLRNEETKTQIAKVFSTANVSNYIPLRGTELEAFVRRYTPAVNIYRANDFVLVNYLNNCYKKFMQLHPSQRQILPDSGVFKQ